jgi:hypothetical protein
MNQPKRQRARETYRSFRHKFFSIGEAIWKIAAKTISLISIGLGGLLLILGLLMLVVDTGLFMSSTRVSLVSNNFLSTLAQFPGIPFDLSELTTSPATVAGIVVWILGLDVMLVGLGLWVKNRFARYTGIIVFGMAAFFDFVKFLLSGILGAPSSVIELIANSIILYCLFKSEIWADA